jgi:hypothetical protein
VLITAAIVPHALSWLRRAQAHLRKEELVTGAAMTLSTHAPS